MANNDLINTIRLKLRVKPQAAKVIAAMVSEPGRFFPTKDILEIVDYVSTDSRAWTVTSASRVVGEARSALRDWQIRENILTLQKTGYVMTDESAKAVLDFIA